MFRVCSLDYCCCTTLPVPRCSLCSRTRKRGGAGLNMLGGVVWEAGAMAVIATYNHRIDCSGMKQMNYAFIPLVVLMP